MSETQGIERFLKGSGLAKLMGDAVPHLVFNDFAGFGERFRGRSWAVRVVSTPDLNKATRAAYENMRAWGWTDDQLAMADQDVRATHEGERRVQVLFHALVEPEHPAKQFASTADEIRTLLYPDEISALFDRYLAFVDERSPLSKARSFEEVEGMLDAMGKGWTSPRCLLSYDAASLRFMLTELASRLATLTKQLSSPTSPSSASNPE